MATFVILVWTSSLSEYVNSIGFEGFSNLTPMCKITLNSKKISNDLIDKGILPNKSLILQPPKIAQQFYKPFILGYFNGDGSIFKTSQYNNYSISIQGTKEILNYLSSNYDISKVVAIGETGIDTNKNKFAYEIAKDILNIDNSVVVTNKEKESVINNIKSIKNLIITYKLKTPFASFSSANVIDMEIIHLIILFIALLLQFKVYLFYIILY